jgi:hypothetical protein
MAPQNALQQSIRQNIGDVEAESYLQNLQKKQLQRIV